MTIHDTHPFLDPEGSRDPVRQFRGRLGGAVTLWTAGSGDTRAGLTVTSLMVAAGEPGRVIGLVDPDSDFAERVFATRRCVVQLLEWGDRDLADMFAGVTPAPGGPFRQATFVDTDWGPRLASATTWVGAVVESTGVVGWSLQVTCALEQVTVGGAVALEHRRGRYVRPGPH